MNIEPGSIKQIPYGIADYGLIRAKNYYYVDKTQYLGVLKKAGRYLFLIRPRRFGKSLFITLMEAYFDVYYKDRFDELFKDTWIYEQPTDERGKYLVLTFNFSVVDPDPAKMEESFLHHIKGRALSFQRKYAEYFIKDREYTGKIIETARSASDILSAVIDLCKDSNRQLYVLIDEYDNFANTILSTVGTTAYEKLTRGPGFFRSFFNVLKSGTGGMDAPIAGAFITGVSPITMDDVTSGFNIGENVSLDAAFNQVLGFTRSDVEQILNYYREQGLVIHDHNFLMEIIRRWYGDYLFSKYPGAGERLYNPDMVLYFLKEYFKTRSIPDDLIDRNVRIDYGKLRHLVIADRDKTKSPTTNGNFNKLKKIIEEGGVSTGIARGFPLEKLMEAENFNSLLFYLGLLTIKGPEKDKVRLQIPNETVKRLYYDYIEEAYRETGIFDLDLGKYANLMTDMAYDGKWRPLIELIADRMRQSMSLRDLITGEKSIQAFLNVYRGLSNLYIIHTEREFNKGYIDIFMEPFRDRYEGIKFSYILEIKYMKTGAPPEGVKIQKLKEEAGEQLNRYSIDERFKQVVEKTRLIKLVLIFSGHECLYAGEI